jgi:hypothetical protein
VFPILRRQTEVLALGYVTARIVECTFIAAGIVFALGIVSLRHDSPDAADLAVSLAALKDWTFLLGPGFIVGWGNGLILGYLMYSSRLVPRGMAWLGLIVGPLIILTGIGTLFESVGPGQHGARHHGDPGVPVGAVARDLRGGLGIPEGCSDPFAGEALVVDLGAVHTGSPRGRLFAAYPVLTGRETAPDACGG